MTYWVDWALNNCFLGVEVCVCDREINCVKVCMLDKLTVSESMREFLYNHYSIIDY